LKKSWLTSLFGILTGVPLLLHQSGVSVGHIGSGDWLSAISAVGAVLLGLSAKDANVSNASNPVSAEKVGPAVNQ